MTSTTYESIKKETQLLREQLAKMEIISLEKDVKILKIDYETQQESPGWTMVAFREYMKLRECKLREIQDKRREIQDKEREIMEETTRKDFEVKERNDTQHRSPNIGGEERWELFENENMEYRNSSNSSGHGKHLHDAHRQDDKYSSRTNQTTSDTLVHRYTPDGVKREPVGGLHLHSSTTSDTLVRMYAPVGAKREPVGALHRHSATEDNATSFSNKIKLSVVPASNRTKTVVMAANTEATKSQRRSLPNVEQRDSTSDDVPQRPTTEMLPDVRPKAKRSTLPTQIPLVACMTKAESKRFQWERGRSEEAKFEEYEPRMHPGGGTTERKGNMFIDTGNMFSESVAQFDDTQLVSAQAPVPDAAAGTVAPPGQTEVETLLSFSALLCPRDGGPELLGSTFLRRQNMVDHVTHHEMEEEKRRRRLEQQEFTRKQMKEKEQAPRTEQEQNSISARSNCDSNSHHDVRDTDRYRADDHL